MQTVSSNEMTLNPPVHTKLTNALLIRGMIAGPCYWAWISILMAWLRKEFNI